MRTLSRVVLLLSGTLTMAACGRLVTLASAAVHDVTPASLIEWPRLFEDPDDAPRFDLLGNEVEPAIGDYRIDVEGDLYEHHSPDTEITELPVPIA